MRKFTSNILYSFISLSFIIPHVAMAATTDGPSFGITAYSTAHSILTMVYSVMVMLMFYALKVLETFMDPDFTLALANGTNAPLLDVWQISRDIVNVIFGMLLVVVALYTVVKADATKAKEYAGKFVIAVILVNFSWFGPRVVLDFANVLTASIYSIPAIVLNDVCTTTRGGNNCLTFTEIIPYSPSEAEKEAVGTPLRKCFDNRNATSAGAGDYIVVNDNVCLKIEEYKLSSNSSMLSGFLSNYTLILNAGKLPTSGPNASVLSGSKAAINEYMDFTVKIFFNFILTMALAIPIMAMAVIFFVRTFILWITIAFMPFAFIGFLVGDKLGTGNPMIIWEKFWKNAILPAVLAVPIAIGMIMILSLINNQAGICANPSPALKALCNNAKIPIIGMSTWFHFIWYMMAIGVIYFGFFTATKFDSIAEQVGGFFKSFGSAVMRAPLMLPVIPAGMSPRGNSTTLGEAASIMSPNGINSLINKKIYNNNDTSGQSSIDRINNDSKLKNNIEEGMRKGLTELKDALRQHNSGVTPDKKIVIDSSNVNTIADNGRIDKNGPAFKAILDEIKAKGSIQ